ncbi:MAG: putative lipid II flippase FtsW [Burkholderiales bacterium]|nr:putative lipid II flippase FtsW [Burkholderiales bacterium]
MLKFFKKDREGDVPIRTKIGDSAVAAIASPRLNTKINVQPDWGVLFVVFSLVLIGTLMVFSASISLSDAPKYKVAPESFLIKHLISLAIALSCAYAVNKVPMRVWETLAPYVFIFGVALLVAVLIPSIGRNVNGASRWIQVGPLRIQATEFMKIAVLLYAANFIVRKQNYMHSFKKAFLPMGIVVACVGFLVLEEPDLGAFMMILIIAMGLLYLGGVNFSIFLSMIGVVVALIVGIVVTSPWRMQRIFAYMDPWSKDHALGKSYQLSHSLIAFGRGEIWGVGLGDAIEKQNYLPEAHTDFILAIIGEELGFIGVAVILMLFVWLVRRAFEIGRKAIKLEHVFSGLVAQGIAIWLGAQTFINVGVASGLLPTKGLTLPFVSFGGSALMATLCAIGLLLRIDYENKVTMRGGRG